MMHSDMACLLNLNTDMMSAEDNTANDPGYQEDIFSEGNWYL